MVFQEKPLSSGSQDAIVLARPTAFHLEELAIAGQALRASRNPLPSLSGIQALESAKALARLLRQAERDEEQVRGRTRALVVAHRAVGLVTAVAEDWSHGVFQAQCWVHPNYQRQGCATAAMKQLAQQMRGYGMQRMELHCAAADAPAIALAKTLGGVLEGQTRGRYLVDGQRLDGLLFGVWLPEQRLI
jgi:RimJ/RimL family protein N-acetyltransferase